MEKHARKVINYSKTFTCGDDSAVTNRGYQLISENATSFVCRSCYERKYANEYPLHGQFIRDIIPHEVVLSGNYDENSAYDETVNATSNTQSTVQQSQAEADDRYVQIVIPESSNNSSATITETSAQLQTQSVDIRLNNDNTLQILLPRQFVEGNEEVKFSLVIV